MEPLAPGTEDDPLYTQVSKPSKKEAAEEQALSKKAFLPNGKYGNIFELNYVQGAQHWFCKVCDCPVLGKLFNHEIGKRHTANLDKWNKKVEKPEKENSSASEGGGGGVPDTPIVVAPGEPVPPGFEGEVEKTTLIQERLDGFNAGPLVGLEYLLELLDYDPSKEPLYLCILCDKKGDPRTVLTHLSSYNHQVNYLQKHFPTVYRHIAPYMIKAYKRNWQSGLQKIAEAIETTFGRLKPMQVEAGKFEGNRMHYIEIVAKGKHFNELSGHTFERVVSVEDLTKVHEEAKPYDNSLPFRKKPIQATPKRKSPSPPVVARPLKRSKPPAEVKARKSLSPVSDISSSDLEDFDPKSLGKSAKQDQKTHLKNKETFSRRERSPPTRRASPPSRRRDGPMPWQKSNYGRGKVVPLVEKRRDERTEKVEEYKKLSKAIDNDMEQILKKNKQNPEKHPKYNDEWKKFWNVRYKELQAEGKNASTHDFKPEWIEFWNKRMLELHLDEVKNKKIALRKRLGLPDEPTPISFKIGERRRTAESGSKDNKPLPTAAQPDCDPEVIVIDDNDKDSTRSRSPSRHKRRTGSTERRDRSPQYRKRSPIGRRFSPPSRRRESPPRKISPLVRRVSPMSPVRRRSLERKVSPPAKKLSTPPRHSPPMRREQLRFSPPARRYSLERSPVPDRFGRSRDKSDDRGRSRELSWEKDRHRDFDDKLWDRSYRGRAPWEAPPPWDHRYPPHIMVDPYAPPKVLRDVTREPVRETVPAVEDDEVNIVSVLRLLTALEERLGSLGPKVIELLGQALAMEKKSANSSEELLDNDINCVLFETVKEKLKGQLLAGFVDRIQEKAFKTAIRKTASLIHTAGERKKQREVELPKKPVVVPGVGTVDKGKIARQIANALIAQGKTDVTQSELEQLINAVVGIAEAQKTSSEPMTTASFLEKLASGEKLTTEKAEPPPPSLTSIETKKEIEEIVSKPKEAVEEDHEEISNNSLDKSFMNMDGLSDSDLETLLQNFKDLSTDEQHGLINYLKKLEAKEPDRVEKLRKFVTFTESMDEKKESGRFSPFSNRTGSLNPASKDEEHKGEKTDDDKKSAFVTIDSEDEEYSFEDVAKAASQKVIEKEMEQKRIEAETKREVEDKNLNDAKALITSLMSSLNKNSSTSSSSNVPSADKEAKQSPTGKINIISNVPVSSADLAKSLSGITMSVSSLGSILGNVQNLTKQNQDSAPVENKSNNFPPSGASPIMDRPNPRNSYNDFDISSQKDVRGKPEYIPSDMSRNRPLPKVYDDFNIGPNPGELRDEMGNLGRGSNFLPIRGPAPGFANNKPTGFLDRNLPSQDRIPPFDRNAPYTPSVAGGFRGNPSQQVPPSSYSNQNQFPPRAGLPPNKMRTGPNNFDSRGGQGDFGPDREFRGGMNEARGGDFRGGEFRSGPNSDFRGGSGDFRGGSEFRGMSGDFRPDFRGEPRGPHGNFRGGGDDVRNGPGDMTRGGPPMKAGLPIDPNRLGNSGPPRYSGNFSGGNNYNNSYKRW